jgi:Uma2 family endonuclease
MSAVHERVGMPLDEFLELGSEYSFEIINGERIPKLPNPVGHSYLIRLLSRLLSASTDLDECFSETTYILPDRYDSNWVVGSRIPDVMFIRAERWAAYIEAHADWKEKPSMLVPDLGIEVVSPNDKVSKLDEKIDQYLADGVQRAVVVDPQRRKVVVYRHDASQPLHLGGEATLDLSDVIPGFTVALSTLFA